MHGEKNSKLHLIPETLVLSPGPLDMPSQESKKEYKGSDRASLHTSHMHTEMTTAGLHSGLTEHTMILEVM